MEVTALYKASLGCTDGFDTCVVGLLPLVGYEIGIGHTVFDLRQDCYVAAEQQDGGYHPYS